MGEVFWYLSQATGRPLTVVCQPLERLELKIQSAARRASGGLLRAGRIKTDADGFV